MRAPSVEINIVLSGLSASSAVSPQRGQYRRQLPSARCWHPAEQPGTDLSRGEPAPTDSEMGATELPVALCATGGAVVAGCAKRTLQVCATHWGPGSAAACAVRGAGRAGSMGVCALVACSWRRRKRAAERRRVWSPLSTGFSSRCRVEARSAPSLGMRIDRLGDPVVPEGTVPGASCDAEGPPALLLTVSEAARLLAIGRTSLYRLIDNGELRVVKIGRATRVPVAELRTFVGEAQQRPGERSSR